MIHSRYQDISVKSFISHYHVKRPIDWTEAFVATRPLHVEIGSGLGEFLVQMASRQSDCHFVGIERDWKRVKKILQKTGSVDNIRVLQVDAVVAMERLFAPRTINRMYCLFPCPWPKERHIKHRLFSHDFFKLLNSRLVESGEMQIVTDHLLFFNWMQEQTGQTGFKTQTRSVKPQFDTKFERKWCREGQKEFFELNLVKEEHCDVPLEEDVQVKVYFADHFDPGQFHFPDVKGNVSVILKDFLFDTERQKAMLRVIVAEKNMTQHVWIAIVKCRPPKERQWCIARAEGHTVIPTKGVAFAIRHVFETIKKNAIS